MTSTGPGEVSAREAEVLEALGARLSNAQIARRLHISVRTVESHVSSLLRKYGVADRRALAALAEESMPQTGAPPGRMTGLPAARTSFVGRGREREAVLGALENSRLVTLLGPGGVGKTRLAVVAAESAMQSFPSGGAFVDLVPVGTGFVAQAVAAALGVSEHPRQPLEDAVAEHLGRGRSLLVLDNCEHLLDAVAGFAERLLSVSPGTRILVTSRARLGVPGERTVPIAPLPLASEAELLFRERAVAADPDFTAEPALISELCAKLDGMPLAIELAAARSASLGADGLLTALDDILRLLTGGRGSDERHRSLRRVIGWSHDLLDDDERALFRRLAVFAGRFDLGAALAVTPDGSRSSVADVLGRLVDQSLVVHQRGPVSRWRLLETVRVFAAAQLADSGELAATRERHLRWATAAAAALEDRLAGEWADGVWRDDFDAVADDLRAALANAPPGPGAPQHRLARSLGHLTYARRFLTESLSHFQEAATRAVLPGEAARDLRSAADCAHAVAPSGHQAFELLLASADRARACGDGAAQAVALALAVVTANRFSAGFPSEIPHERLSGLLDEAVSAGGSDDPVVVAAIAAARAWNAGPAKMHPDPALSEIAVAAARSAGDPVLVSAGLDAVSTAAATAGRLREAHRVTRERFSLLADLPRDDPYASPEIVDIHHMASTYAIATGDLDAALSAARAALDDDLLGDRSPLSAGNLVLPLVLTGQFEEALQHAATVWDGWEQASGRVAGWMSPAVAAVALAYSLLGDERGSRLWRARATQVAGQARNHASFATFVDARIAVHTRRYGDAVALVRLVFTDFPQGRYQTYARAAGAELAVAAGLPDAALRLDAAAPAGDENEWAAACLARAAGRLRGDAAALERSVRGWERIGARFERACTLLLLPGREAEGRAEMAALGCPPSGVGPESHPGTAHGKMCERPSGVTMRW
ncbi:LuxR C-terminal-related transcriptional regulator [Sphaerimonospora cavernae]|uniref:LuxR C-terminal-related transcriptional regulator n=1 Tax=Sphaerimonospora cavernae TaxID=1740611 RepID=A0ABV6U5Y6_9ACTN